MVAHAAAPPLLLPLRVSSPSPAAAFLFSLLVFIFLSLSPVVIVCSNAVTEARVLAEFRASLSHKEAILSWDPSASKPCSGSGSGSGLGGNSKSHSSSNWLGVICLNDTIWGLQLENMDLSGNIDVDALSQLDQLRTLSFENNKFEGPIPDFRKLQKLRSVYLSNNRFSGEIPDDAFLGLNALRRLHLANNSFSGNIPTSLTTLPRLVEVRLEGNGFQGTIPNFEPIDPIVVNVADNKLEGPIPPSLSKLTAGNFAGNKALCGPPLDTCTNNGNTTNPTTSNGNTSASKANYTAIIVLSVLVALAILSLILAVALFYNRKRRQKEKLGRYMSSNRQHKLAAYDGNRVAYTPPEEYYPEAKKAERGKLAFVREDRGKFDLSELLRASAEVLGSGNFGSSYKAVMLDGQAIVVKRFRQMNRVGRQDFYEHMTRMGKLRHPNVLPVVACYHRKEEKLLVCDFADNGSLASHLHGSRNMNYPGLDWQTRLRIIKGITRGLAYLYSEFPTLTTPHSHLKSSNVLLNSSFEPLLSDYALMPLINTEQAQQLMVAFKSPEFLNQGHITKKTDVWSLGILILEMLTGKFPTNYLAVGSVGSSLAGWVNTIASKLEGRADHLFDKEMAGTQNAQGEMRKLLKIGLSCCEEDVDIRWSIEETMEMIEQVKERDN